MSNFEQEIRPLLVVVHNIKVDADGRQAGDKTTAYRLPFVKYFGTNWNGRIIVYL